MADYKHFGIEHFEDVTVIRLRQAPTCDPLTVAELRDELVKLLTTEDPEKLVIDFEQIERFPSVAATSLLCAKKHLRGHPMKISGMREQVQLAYRFLNMHGTVFAMHPTARDAVASFADHGVCC